ncbi:MAG: iron donor protein CyaY [Gammaproteobacteria bacterium]|nr:iron donor protein CyaY [Gammaproteobacteria bacterium]
MNPALSESEFHSLVDRTLAALEKAIDASGADIDYDSAGGVLTLEFGNRSKLILSRQPPLRQLWVAARSGGFHYDWDGAAWVHDQGGEALAAMLARFIREQSGETVNIEW